MAKTLSEIIEEIPDDGGAPRYITEKVMISIRIPLEDRIFLDVIAKKVKKTRTAFAGELLRAAIQEVRDSTSFSVDDYEEYKRLCLKAGVFLDEFLTKEEQLTLFQESEIAKGDDDVQA